MDLLILYATTPTTWPDVAEAAVAAITTLGVIYIIFRS